AHVHVIQRLLTFRQPRSHFGHKTFSSSPIEKARSAPPHFGQQGFPVGGYGVTTNRVFRQSWQYCRLSWPRIGRERLPGEEMRIRLPCLSKENALGPHVAFVCPQLSQVREKPRMIIASER